MSISKSRDGYRTYVQLPGGQRRVTTFPSRHRARDRETAQLATVAATPVSSEAGDSSSVGEAWLAEKQAQAFARWGDREW